MTQGGFSVEFCKISENKKLSRGNLETRYNLIFLLSKAKTVLQVNMHLPFFIFLRKLCCGYCFYVVNPTRSIRPSVRPSVTFWVFLYTCILKSGNSSNFAYKLILIRCAFVIKRIMV